MIVPVPEAEHAVRRFRAHLDPSAAWGVPAHVTVLYPFVPPEHIDEDVLVALGQAIGSVPAAPAVFRRVERFGDSVVWLAPEPAALFRELTRAVWARFPGCPPYAGAHDDIVPHLTIGDSASESDLSTAAESVRAHLPIQANVVTAHLICGSRAPDSWRTVAELPLGA